MKELRLNSGNIDDYFFNARSTDSGNWQVTPSNGCYIIPTSMLTDSIIVKSNIGNANYAFIESNNIENNSALDFYGNSGLTRIDSANETVIDINKDAKYLYLASYINNYPNNSCLDYVKVGNEYYYHQLNNKLSESEQKISPLFKSIRKYMSGNYSNLFGELFWFGKKGNRIYLRKLTDSTITLGIIEANNTTVLGDINYTVGEKFKYYKPSNGFYIEGVVKDLNGITFDRHTVTDVKLAEEREIVAKEDIDAFYKETYFEEYPIYNCLFKEIYVDSRLNEPEMYYLRGVASDTKVVTIGIVNTVDGTTTVAMDIPIDRGVVSGKTNRGDNFYIVFSDALVSGRLDAIHKRGIDYQHTILNEIAYEIDRNQIIRSYLQTNEVKQGINIYKDSSAETGTELMKRMLNSRVMEKDMIENRLFQVNGSDASICYDSNYIYSVYVNGDSNDVYWKEGAYVELSVNQLNNGNSVKTIKIAEKGSVILVDEVQKTIERGASMPNCLITDEGLVVVFTSMVDGIFCNIRCLINTDTLDVVRYNFCKIGDAIITSSVIRDLGGVYESSSDYTLHMNATFRDAKDDEGYYYVGGCGAEFLKYPIILRTKDFIQYEFFMFVECEGMNAAYECTTGIGNDTIGGRAAKYLYIATRQAKSYGNNKYIIVNVVNLQSKDVVRTDYIEGSDARPCIFSHRDGSLILAYSMANARTRVRLVRLKYGTGVSTILQDAQLSPIGYCNFIKSNIAPIYYCIGAVGDENSENQGQYVSTVRIEHYKMSDARKVLDNLINLDL